MRYQDALCGLVLVALFALLFIAALGMASALPVQDLAQYWAGAHLITQNPYSLQLVTNFERSLGISNESLPMVMRNPPWVVILVLPLGLFNYQTAFAFWALLSLVIVAGCSRAAWDLVHPEPSLSPAFLSLLFGPTVCLLLVGQIAVLVLLGVTLFLCMVERKHDWRAGAALLLTTAKPHIALFFLIVVVLWSVRSRRWAILASSTLALVTCNVIVLALNPCIFSQYLSFAREFVHETTPYPNVGGILYLATGKHSLAFLPMTVGGIWLVHYWRKHRATWDWKTSGPMVLLVSLTSSYYSFQFDQIVALPALMDAFANGNRRKFLVGFVLINAGYALHLSNVAGRMGFGHMFLWWTAIAWLITYLSSREPRQAREPLRSSLESLSLETRADAESR